MFKILNKFTVEVFVDAKVKNPQVLINKLFSGIIYMIEEFDKYIQYGIITDTDGKVIADNTVIDWGM